MLPPASAHPASYRDPAGFVYIHDGRVFRQVNPVYAPHYRALMDSGLYAELTDKKLLLPHHETTGAAGAYLTLAPERVPFISYAHEWCFGQWQEAAGVTLAIARAALAKGMVLKDATSYNLQWQQGRMVHIDTLSFEKREEEKPWIAYRQFCEQFLAPLALMHYHALPLQPLALAWPEGVPLPVASKLLPKRSRWNLNLQLHLHLHARMYAKAPAQPQKPGPPFSAAKLDRILQSLESAVRGLRLDAPTGVWSGYYTEALQRNDYVAAKSALIDRWVGEGIYSTALDAGANEGTFSLLLAAKGIYTLSADSDHYSVNRLYAHIKKEGITNLQPMVADLAQPAPSYGLNLDERASLFERTGTDLVLALAVLHHLCIGRNIPFERAAQLFGRLGKTLIIEFVPKSDPYVQTMLQGKQDIYDWYRLEAFEAAFGARYHIRHRESVGSSGRTLYLMEPLHG